VILRRSRFYVAFIFTSFVWFLGACQSNTPEPPLVTESPTRTSQDSTETPGNVAALEEPTVTHTSTAPPAPEAIMYLAQGQDAVGDLRPLDPPIHYASSDGGSIDDPSWSSLLEYANGKFLVWSPDGHRLLFDGSIPPSGESTKTDNHLFLADISQNKVEMAVPEGFYFNSRAGAPSWSPGGKYFVVSLSDAEGALDLYTVEVPEGRFFKLTSGPGTKLYPAWSPDGNWITFALFSTGDDQCGPYFPDHMGCDQAELMLIGPDGSQPQNLNLMVNIGSDLETRDPAYNTPEWSPDGSWILTQQGEDQSNLAVINPFSGETIELTQTDSYDFQPTWSADGKKIAYVSDVNGNDDIYILIMDENISERVTHNPSDDYLPVWSPSGMSIAFLSDRNKSYFFELYNSGLNNGDTLLMSDEVVLTKPAWIPSE
jgi:Tol biopolymer transport system component